MPFSIKLDQTDTPDGDIIVVPVDHTGTPGPLNSMVFKKIGAEFPKLTRRSFRNGCYYHRLGFENTPYEAVLFVVTTGAARPTDSPDLIARHLYFGLDQVFKIAATSEVGGTKIWIPLLGTGFVGLSYRESLSAILDCLLGFPPTTFEIDVEIQIAVPPSLLDNEFAEILIDLQSHPIKASLSATMSSDDPDVAHYSPEEGDPDLTGDGPISSDDEDELDYVDYADAISAVIRNPKLTEPLLIAVDAPWGTGKSSLGKLLVNRLEAQGVGGRHHTTWFNAWLHDDADRLPSAFISAIARAADEKRSWVEQFIAPLPDEFLPAKNAAKRRWRRRIALSVAIVFGIWVGWDKISGYMTPYVDAALDLLRNGSASTGNGNGNSDATGLGKLLTAIITAVVGFGLPKIGAFFSRADHVSAFVADGSVGARHGSLELARQELRKIIHGVTEHDQRFVIIVDDLERVRPPRAVDLLETINQLLNFERVVVVVLTDLQILSHCIDIKYQELSDRRIVGSGSRSTASGDFGRQFMRKLVQLEFLLPPIPRWLAGQVFAGIPKNEQKPETTQETIKAEPKEDRWYEGISPLKHYRRYFARANLRKQSANLDVSEETIAAAGLSKEEADDLRAEVADIKLATASEIFEVSRVEVLRAIETRPRLVKRAMNRLKMLIIVLHRRNLLLGENGISAKQLGQWVALEQKYPNVLRGLIENPSYLDMLSGEGAGTKPRSKLWNEISEAFDAMPGLEGIAERMIYLRIPEKAPDDS